MISKIRKRIKEIISVGVNSFNKKQVESKLKEKFPQYFEPEHVYSKEVKTDRNTFIFAVALDEKGRKELGNRNYIIYER